MAIRRRYETVDDIPPFARTVGAAKAADILIQASCSTCGRHRPVDLDRVIGAKGPAFSLVNRRPRCTLTDDCLGRVRFSHSGRGVLRSMETPDYRQWWDDRDRDARHREEERVRERHQA